MSAEIRLQPVPEEIHLGITFDPDTDTYAVIFSSAIIGRFDTYGQALRALEKSTGSHLGSPDLIDYEVEE